MMYNYDMSNNGQNNESSEKSGNLFTIIIVIMTIIIVVIAILLFFTKSDNLKIDTKSDDKKEISTPTPTPTLDLSRVEIFLINPDITIKVGETNKIEYYVVGNSGASISVNFSSSNNGIASVDDSGNVKGIADGNTTITLTYANGKTVTCNVRVEATSSYTGNMKGGITGPTGTNGNPKGPIGTNDNPKGTTGTSIKDIQSILEEQQKKQQEEAERRQKILEEQRKKSQERAAAQQGKVKNST